MQWEVSVFSSHRIPRKSHRMRWEKPGVSSARCRVTQPKTLVRLGVFNLLWLPCLVLCALGDLPWGILFHRPDSGMELLPFKEFFVCSQQLLKWIFLISMSRGQGQGGKEVTFVIVLFWWTTESAHLGVWKHMAKSLFLLILNLFERCKIPSVEKHLDLHLETNKQKPNQIFTKL